MKFKRILRKVHARWRLHRMEWNNLHAPLQPPKGYEKYHTKEAVFPGLRNPIVIRNWKEFKWAMRGAWKIYMHTYRFDPEVQRFLDDLDRKESEYYENRGKHAAKVITEAATEGKRNIEKLGAELKEAAPGAKEYLKDRAGMLQNAVSEFAAGFHDTVDGKMNVWGLTPEQQKDIDDYDGLEKNSPVVYRVRSRDDVK